MKNQLKRLNLASFFLIIFTTLFSQTKPYFQQEVNYKIDVTLDDKRNLLTGNIEIEYRNNSPDQLDSIYFHLWPNAYKSVNTAFAKQQLRAGSTRFYFAKEGDRGFIDKLAFTVDGQPSTLQVDEQNPDIARLLLNKPLIPEKKIIIRTPFRLKIPASFSRLGHVDKSYQITQWYPKPAVYDCEGWHPMPYLELGEFYSEFGSFDVKITLPENYVVGATGVLQTESERAFLNQKVKETEALMAEGFSEKNSFPRSSRTMKTIRYKAGKVHDFAWFADKRFHVQKSEVTLASGRKVDTWTMFTNEEADLWKKSIEYVNHAVAFYSEKIGEYPWPQATAVQSGLSAGAGMEYPMITVIGLSGDAKSLDDVIAHEVGHNWLYGVLAFNERVHPWMDEGINSYYEVRYMNQFYPGQKMVDIPEFLTRESGLGLYEAAYLYLARLHLDQAPETHSNEMPRINYGIAVYLKPSLIFRHLEKYLGAKNFDSLMHSFYEKWQFKHPRPEDLRKRLETGSGKDLSWFFDGYVFSNKKPDYAVTAIKKSSEGFEIQVVNKGEVAAPFPVSGMKNGKPAETKWFEGFEGTKEIHFPKGDYERLVLDAEHFTLDVNRSNNSIRPSGRFKKLEPVQLKFLTAIENSRRTSLFWLPMPVWNKYDQFVPGMLVYNSSFPSRKFEFEFAPMFSFETKELDGLGNLSYHLYPKTKAIQRMTFSLSAKSFNFRKVDSLRNADGEFRSTHLKFVRIVPSLKVELGKAATSNFYQSFQFRTIWLSQQFATFDPAGNYEGDDWDSALFNELTYEAENRRALNPFGLKVSLEERRFDGVFGRSQNYLKASLEFKTAYTYDRGKNINLRFFFGGFLKNTARNRGAIFPGAFNLTSQGFNDYRYDDAYFGRTETNGFWSQQIALKEGGMKTAFGSPFAPGRSNDFIVAINLKGDLPKDLPLKLPVKPYFDIGYYNDKRQIAADLSFNDQLWWSFGFMFDFADGLFGIYFPVLNSNNVDDLYDQSDRSNYFKRVTFSMDLNRLNPWEVRDRLKF